MKKFITLFITIIFMLILCSCGRFNNFSLHFDVDGENYYTIYKSSDKLPEEPTKDGYIFNGWYLEDGSSLASFNLIDLLKLEDTTVYARWISEATYTLTFDSNGGDDVQSITKHGGEDIVEPTAPLKDNYVFDGWYTDNSTFLSAYTFLRMPESNTTLYAKWAMDQDNPPAFSVAFQSNGGVLKSGEEVQEITYGNTPTPPQYEKKGYTLSWDIAFDSITHNTVINAVWNKIGDYSTVLEYLWDTNKDVVLGVWEDEFFTQVNYEFTSDYLGHGIKALIVNGSYPLAIEYSNDLLIEDELDTLNALLQGRSYTRINASNILCYDVVGFPYLLGGDYVLADNAYYNNNYEVLIKYMGQEAEFTIPDGVKEIGESAFALNTELTSISIPESVTIIGRRAFAHCSSLNTIVIPSNVTRIENDTFAVSGLTSINIPGSVTYIGDWAFSGCRQLTSVTLTNGLTRISDGAFSSCTSITTIEIPESVTYIGDSVFSSCNNLISIILPYSLTYIGDRTFSHCSKLPSIIIPANVTFIGEGAFLNCSSLTSITLPNSLSEISPYIFAQCSSLTDIIIPSSITSIGYKAFQECSALESIIIPFGVTIIAFEAFYDCFNITIYAEAQAKPSGWAADWKIPSTQVVWGYSG